MACVRMRKIEQQCLVGMIKEMGREGGREDGREGELMRNN